MSSESRRDPRREWSRLSCEALDITAVPEEGREAGQPLVEDDERVGVGGASRRRGEGWEEEGGGVDHRRPRRRQRASHGEPAGGRRRAARVTWLRGGVRVEISTAQESLCAWCYCVLLNWIWSESLACWCIASRGKIEPEFCFFKR